MIARTTSRVSSHTPVYLNERIRHKTRLNIARYGKDAATINKRLDQLNREWDVERVLETNASTLVVIGVLLGTFVNPWFYLVPLLVGSFLLQHAIQGWCPPIRLLRRIGLRTHAEIASEYYALRSLRGDFIRLYPQPLDIESITPEDAYILFRWTGEEGGDMGEEVFGKQAEASAPTEQ
jgi:hypothetical protein